MNWLDWVLTALIAGCTLYGAYRGLIVEVAGFLGWIGGIVIGFFFSDQITKWLSGFLDIPDVLPVLSFVGVAVAFRFALLRIAHLIRTGLDIVQLGWADRLGGLALGLIKGIVIIWAILVLGVSYVEPLKDGVKQSKVAPHILSLSERANRWLPENLREKFEDHMDDLKKLWEKTMKA